MSQRTLDDKLDRMREILAGLECVAVAFSAGVDSTLVTKVAADVLGVQNVTAVTGKSDALASRELAETRTLANLIGVEHVVLDTDEFDNPNYVTNPANRCYFCKTTLYDRLGEFIRERGINAIVNGINADDHADWRPGIRAAHEHDVHAPAAEAGLTKMDLRVLSERFNLPTHNKPASPCLSSRVQYGETITGEKLRRIESCESFLHDMGLRECRVRHHNDIARIEVPPSDITTVTAPEVRSQIDAHFRSVGYTYVTVDLRGFRSGSMNDVIPMTVRSRPQS